MKRRKTVIALLVVSLWVTALVVHAGELREDALSQPKVLAVERGVTAVERSCIECHSRAETGPVYDWPQSLRARQLFGAHVCDMHHVGAGGDEPHA